jgi:large subunit ribosomal protein L24
MNNLHVKTGDNVMVISGKDKGQTGKVLQTSPKEGKVIVEGLNMVTKHVKPRRQGEQGGIVKAEGAIYACKVMPVCPKCGKATRVGHSVKDGYPVLRAAFTGTHSGAGRLLGNGLVGEDLDPDLAATLDITGHGNTSCLDLVGGDPSRLESDQAVIALVDLVAAHGLTGHAAALDAAVLNTLRQ